MSYTQKGSDELAAASAPFYPSIATTPLGFLRSHSSLGSDSHDAAPIAGSTAVSDSQITYTYDGAGRWYPLHSTHTPVREQDLDWILGVAIFEDGDQVVRNLTKNDAALTALRNAPGTVDIEPGCQFFKLCSTARKSGLPRPAPPHAAPIFDPDAPLPDAHPDLGNHPPTGNAYLTHACTLVHARLHARTRTHARSYTHARPRPHARTLVHARTHARTRTLVRARTHARSRPHARPRPLTPSKTRSSFSTIR